MKLTRAGLPVWLWLCALGRLWAADSVVLHHRNPEVGDVRHQWDQKTIVSSMEVTVDAQKSIPVEVTERSFIKKRLRVLEARDDRIVAIEVKYEDWQVDRTLQKSEPDPSTLVGRTYRVVFTEDGPQVDGVDGEDVSEDEAKLIAEDTRGFFTRDTVGRFLDGRRVEIGEVVRIPDNLSRQFFGQDEEDAEVRIEDFTLTLREITTVHGRQAAVFDIAAAVSFEANRGPTAAGDLEGLVVLDVERLWPYSLRMSGTMDVHGEQRQAGRTIVVDGSMEIQLSMRSSYGDQPLEDPEPDAETIQP